MPQLYLFPLDKRLSVRYDRRGWDGCYSIRAVVQEKGQWLPSGDEVAIPKADLEAAGEGACVSIGGYRFVLAKDSWTIYFGGTMFGKTRNSILQETLEEARVLAAKIQESVDRD